MSEAEHEEFMNINRQVEAMNVERITHLVALAQTRQLTLPDVYCSRMKTGHLKKRQDRPVASIMQQLGTLFLRNESVILFVHATRGGF
ncbi:hypothetical protein KFU94_09565 [Chloroflexi bacterium TSY]|nr:hypothetical protein [Chloroflexi bacterium TSY]